MEKYFESEAVDKAYRAAKKAYAKLGVDAGAAIKKAAALPVSIHCWQGDDVNGFEGAGALGGDGILATGDYPGRARNADELRRDAEKAFSLIPGKKRFNLHSMYAETDGKKVPRDELAPEHFSNWMKWAAEKNVLLDFNPSFFSHSFTDNGNTLSAARDDVRKFWIRHGIACRRIASAFGAAQGKASVNNNWVPDGSKDAPADRLSPRLRLRDSLDEILAEKLPTNTVIDAVESKLFGIGSESYVVGSHEFYMGYAQKKHIYLCLDMGHFHPTETIADKISAAQLFVPGLLIHFSRGIRWDSDHVAIWNDDLRDVCRELVRTDYLKKTALALDFFDASINRIAAWAIGSRSLRKGLLYALLEPSAAIIEAEKAGRFHERLALMEEAKTLPFGAVWDKLCAKEGVPVGVDWLSDVAEYEATVLKKR
jgi:L-rhamnose isomerase